MADRYSLTGTLPRSIPADESTDRYEASDAHTDHACRAGTSLASDEAYISLAAFFGALADATRAKIVHLLLHQELCTCDIAAVLGVSHSCVSQHLRILRELRLVASRRAGKFVYYRLDDSHIALLIQLGLTHQSHADQGTLRGGPV
jgi:ArsR family transcriptional regulator